LINNNKGKGKNNNPLMEPVLCRSERNAESTGGEKNVETDRNDSGEKPSSA